MTNLIIMLTLMMTPYLVMRRDFDLRSAAAVGLGLLFIFTGVGHFVQTEAMTQMLPGWLPGRTLLVYATGVLEFVIALGLFFKKSRKLAGWMAIAVLVVFFPANVFAALNNVPMGGHAWGPVYLLARAPL